MRMTPSEFPPKTDRETVTAGFDMTVATTEDPIIDVVLDCDPGGLTLSTPIVTGGQIQWNISGGTIGATHTVSAICTLFSGNVIEPYARLRIIDAGQE